MKAVTWLSLVSLFLLGAMPAPSTPPDICKLKGSVYIEQTASFADFRVFVQDVEAFADLVVYKEQGEIFADKPGHWYITDVKSFADFSIYIEDVEAFADFTIAYTPFQSAAGCNN